MKKIFPIIFLIFIFQSWAKADDIKNFQIEGMSIGDSLLDYFSENQIKKSHRYDNKNTNWSSDKMFQLRTGKKGPYTEILFALKKNDKKYIIYGISGLVKMEYNISDCYPKLEKVSNELKELFPTAKVKKDTRKHDGDNSGKSKITSVNFILPSKDFTSVDCYDWSKKMGYWDNFRITITTKEFNDWLNSQFR